jgi:hypothetical protein
MEAERAQQPHEALPASWFLMIQPKPRPVAGRLPFPILRAHNKAVAAGYLGTRIFEGVDEFI